MADQDPLNISGQVVAEKYRIEHLVGEGGFAAVYLAEHTIWKQPVAVKFFSGLSQAPGEYREELLQQFFQEGALLTELSSQTAGIVQARDVGAYTSGSGQWLPYMVLEWLDGTPLDAILAEDQREGRPWSEGEVVSFLRRILPVLDVAHRRGIAHRDIKPANIFILGSDPRAPETPCKLLDFGVAKMVSDHAKVSAALAKTGVAISSFTPRYGAPEQFSRSHGATGPWTDVYAVALLACEMLVGHTALEGEDMVQFGFSSANPARRPTPRALGATISDRLEAVFAKALAVRPEERFQHAGEFLEGIVRASEPGADLGAALADGAPRSATTSSILPLAPTVLVRTDGRPLAPAIAPEPAAAVGAPAEAAPASGDSSAARPQRPAPERRKSRVGSLLFILMMLAGGLIGYSRTDLGGARELRELFSPALRLVRNEAAHQLPKLREKTRQAVDDAVDLLARPAAQSEPQCPMGTRRVAGASGASEPSCVDVTLVSEVDYDACPTCQRPAIARVKKKHGSKTAAHSAFCTDGKSPRSEPIRCATWKQADIYCATRAARLPTEDELRAMSPAAELAAMEWTQPAPPANSGKGRPFRCARGF